MMRSLFSGVSGLKNHQTRMDVIGNNISNVNTTGFKSSRVTFTDMLSQNLAGASSPNDNIGGTNPKQIGLGSAVGAVDMLFTNGSVQSTGVNTDLALSSSNALFILNTGSGTAYTRNGDFQFDADGNYVQAGNGYYVQGWMADANGSINTSSTQPGNIQIESGKSMAPVASTLATYTNNLNSEIPLITKIAGGEAIMPSATVKTGSASATLTTQAGSSYVVEGLSVGGQAYTPGDSTIPPNDTDSKITSFTPPAPGNGETLTVTLKKTDGTITSNVVVSYDGMKTTFTIPGPPSKEITSSASSFKLGSTEISDGTDSYTVSYAKATDGTITQVSQAKESYASDDRVVATSDSPITLTLNDGTTQQAASGTYKVGESIPIVTTLAVYGTEGSVHEVPIYFTRVDAKSNKWRVSVDNNGGLTTTLPDAAEIAKRTKVTLDGKGQELVFDDHGVFAKGGGTFELTLQNGEQPTQKVSIDLSQLTQYASSSTVAGKANGNAAGTLASISIDKTGTITGTYTNGEKRAEAQVALQRFSNPGGLNKIGESLYEDSNNAGKSGEPSTAAALGATITPSALEMSNVDIANEFTDMIITQRGFQGNSKIITVSDEMLETLINMKR